MTIALTMVFLMTMVLSLHLVVVAQGPGHTDLNGLTDLPGNRVALLPGDGVADLPGDLAGVLDGPLVALPLSVGVALGGGGVAAMSVAGVGLPLVVSTMAVDLGVVANNTGAVVNLLGHLVALLGHNVLALLHIGGVHNGVILRVARLVVLGVAGLVVLSVAGSVIFSVVHGGADLLAVVVLSTIAASMAGSSDGQGRSRENKDELQHSDERENIFPPEWEYWLGKAVGSCCGRRG